MGTWSASASDALRITLERPVGGRTRILTWSRRADRYGGGGGYGGAPESTEAGLTLARTILQHGEPL